jgi:hypothetical protein
VHLYSTYPIGAIIAISNSETVNKDFVIFHDAANAPPHRKGEFRSFGQIRRESMPAASCGLSLNVGHPCGGVMF